MTSILKIGDAVMKLEWMGKYRDFTAALFRAGNAYAQICKQQTVGDKVRFGPYEVQIMEHILEYGDQNKNMIWYSRQLGMQPSTFSKYIKKLVEKGLVEKYQTVGNRKDIILRLSPLAQEEYEKYSRYAYEVWFKDWFAILDTMSPEQLEKTQRIISMWGGWCSDISDAKEEAELIRVE